jgi:prohibitin 2
MSDQQEAFRRFAQQLQRAAQGNGGFPGGSPRGLFAGGGLIIALVAGGLALNASLFNGAHLPAINVRPSILSDPNTVDGGHRAIKYTRYAS